MNVKSHIIIQRWLHFFKKICILLTCRNGFLFSNIHRYLSIYVHYSNVGSYIRILLLTDVSATTYMYPDFVLYISIMFLLSNLWLTWGIGLEPCKVFLAYLDFKWFLRNPKSVAQFSVEPNTCLYSAKLCTQILKNLPK